MQITKKRIRITQDKALELSEVDTAHALLKTDWPNTSYVNALKKLNLTQQV